MACLACTCTGPWVTGGGTTRRAYLNTNRKQRHAFHAAAKINNPMPRTSKL